MLTIKLLLCINAFVSSADARVIRTEASSLGFNVARLERGESDARCAATFVRSDADAVLSAMVSQSGDEYVGEYLAFDDAKRMTRARAHDLILAWQAPLSASDCDEGCVLSGEPRNGRPMAKMTSK